VIQDKREEFPRCHLVSCTAKSWSEHKKDEQKELKQNREVSPDLFEDSHAATDLIESVGHIHL
jgi:hypothetical protein